MTPEDVKEALDSATTDQLIAELIKRPTWQGVVVGREAKGKWKGKKEFLFRFSHQKLNRDQAITILKVAADKLSLK